MPSRAMFNNKGLITAPCAAPRGVGVSISASTYPAFNHCFTNVRPGMVPKRERMNSW